jgi:hypothetical protein
MTGQSATKFNPYNIARGQLWSGDLCLVKVMAFADRYVMARYKGRGPSSPFVMRDNDFVKRFPDRNSCP